MTIMSTLLLAALALAGCGGGGGDSSHVNLNGRVSYASVPAVASNPDADGTLGGKLDYAHTSIKPARGVQVEAVADDGTVLANTQTDAAGHYVLTVPAHTTIRLRAKARLLQAAGNGASWDFSIRDNTSDGYRTSAAGAALYALQGMPFDSGSIRQTQDLHAASGWGGSGYTNPRSAAPFAILDQIYAAKQKVLAVDDKAVFAPMIAYWSPANRAGNSYDPASGNIRTSHWQAGGARPGLYFLGVENLDTDEYDSGVIVHEWGHYFESTFSRSDSPRGPHEPNDLLDMRVAFSEAWGNALASMVRDDALYVDTAGAQQSELGMAFNLDQITVDEPLGWFNESSVQHVLYQLFKAPAIGFGSIYRVMVDQQKNTEALTSLFSFATYLRANAPATAQRDIDFLLAGIDTINGAALDIWGTGQRHTPSFGAGDPASVLPLYTPLATGQPVRICRTNTFNDHDPTLGTNNNKLGNVRYLRISIAQGQDGAYKLAVASDAASSALTVAVYRQGKIVAAQQSAPTAALLPLNLAAGDYVATVTDTDASALLACFTATLDR